MPRHASWSFADGRCVLGPGSIIPPEPKNHYVVPSSEQHSMCRLVYPFPSAISRPSTSTSTTLRDTLAALAAAAYASVSASVGIIPSPSFRSFMRATPRWILERVWIFLLDFFFSSSPLIPVPYTHASVLGTRMEREGGKQLVSYTGSSSGTRGVKICRWTSRVVPTTTVTRKVSPRGALSPNSLSYHISSPPHPPRGPS